MPILKAELESIVNSHLRLLRTTRMLAEVCEQHLNPSHPRHGKPVHWDHLRKLSLAAIQEAKEMIE